MQNAAIQRYNELDAAGSVDPANLVTVEDTLIHILHESDGNVSDVRYKNTGKSLVFSKSGTDYYNTVDSDLVDYDVISSSDNKKFAVDASTYFANALMKSTQFGYNYTFTNNKEDWTDSTGTNETLNTAITTAKSTPADNEIYLKMGTANIPEETDPIEIEKFTVVEETKPNTFDVTIKVVDGRIIGEKFTAIADTDGNEYTITAADDTDIDDFKNLLTSVLKVFPDDDNENTTVEIDEGKVQSKSSSGNTYTIVKDGTTYTFTKTGDYTFEYVLDDGSTYNVTIDPGDITTYKSTTLSPATTLRISTNF